MLPREYHFHLFSWCDNAFVYLSVFSQLLQDIWAQHQCITRTNGAGLLILQRLWKHLKCHEENKSIQLSILTLLASPSELLSYLLQELRHWLPWSSPWQLRCDIITGWVTTRIHKSRKEGLSLTLLSSRKGQEWQMLRKHVKDSFGRYFPSACVSKTQFQFQLMWKKSNWLWPNKD